MKEKLLNQITELSHEFGTSDYVLGGGGNTSAKNDSTLWVKPSGTTLSNLTPDSFVAIDRSKLAELYQVTPPANPSAREALVKEMMSKAVLQQSSGRASVESPLHDSLNARFVVHTHPALVNGMTCSKNGADVCRKLFPDALWLDYIDPGYTLCIQVRGEIKKYLTQFKKEPSIIFLQNHGVFVASDSPEQNREIYSRIFSVLSEQYKKTGISTEIQIKSLPDSGVAEKLKSKIKKTFGDCFVTASGMFDYANGPVSPDHIVYSKSYPFTGEPTTQAIEDYKNKYGYLPKVIVFDDSIFGIGQSEKQARLALELTKDGALVKQLAEAFGGIRCMSDRGRIFIENWEVESYRSKQT